MNRRRAGVRGRPARVLATGLLATMTLVAAAACGTDATGTAAPAPGSVGAADTPTSPVTTSSTTPSAAQLIAGRPYEVRTETRTFVDTSRPTPAGHPGLGPPGELPTAQPRRTLVTEIRVPRGAGPFPLIMFSHGLSGHPDKFSHLLGAWAAAGYVTVAPAFPLTNDTVSGNSGNAFDLWDQPKDISFVLDQVLAADDAPDDPLHGTIDPHRLGAAGLSLGGATTYALLYDDCCRDTRFVAAEVLSGALLPMPQPYDLDRSIPILIMHGDHDSSLPYAGAADAYTRAIAPKMFVTLLGGTHAPPFEDDPTPYDAEVEAVTTDFWDVFLLGRSERRELLQRDLSGSALVTVRADGA